MSPTANVLRFFNKTTRTCQVTFRCFPTVYRNRACWLVQSVEIELVEKSRITRMPVRSRNASERVKDAWENCETKDRFQSFLPLRGVTLFIERQNSNRPAEWLECVRSRFFEISSPLRVKYIASWKVFDLKSNFWFWFAKEIRIKIPTHDWLVNVTKFLFVEGGEAMANRIHSSSRSRLLTNVITQTLNPPEVRPLPNWSRLPSRKVSEIELHASVSANEARQRRRFVERRKKHASPLPRDAFAIVEHHHHRRGKTRNRAHQAVSSNKQTKKEIERNLPLPPKKRKKKEKKYARRNLSVSVSVSVWQSSLSHP